MVLVCLSNFKPLLYVRAKWTNSLELGIKLQQSLYNLRCVLVCRGMRVCVHVCVRVCCMRGIHTHTHSASLDVQCCPVLLLPSSAEDGSLRVGQCFNMCVPLRVFVFCTVPFIAHIPFSSAGTPPCKQIRVFRSFEPPSPTLPDATPKTIEHPKGLKQRWRPFGWSRWCMCVCA